MLWSFLALLDGFIIRAYFDILCKTILFFYCFVLGPGCQGGGERWWESGELHKQFQCPCQHQRQHQSTASKKGANGWTVRRLVSYWSRDIIIQAFPSGGGGGGTTLQICAKPLSGVRPTCVVERPWKTVSPLIQTSQAFSWYTCHICPKWESLLNCWRHRHSPKSMPLTGQCWHHGVFEEEFKNLLNQTIWFGNGHCYFTFLFDLFSVLGTRVTWFLGL